ncbi:hypothetical protein GALMADRAFT_247920 [Galerina marginata CBS 339.88]|uniref:SnoaL-like domain-containing protein n=1 Tax=Galerina marginata (strain CBS 339.88) TaxID=685588 RepID=A0A067T944_GALM3|nr:hypothetical protein GALMADRAFT_247920 [Galerina marginata CBS 339.88]
MSSSHQFNPSESPNYGFTVPQFPSRYLRAFLAYIDAFNAWDLDLIVDCFDEALEHRILPQSLGRPVLNKRQYREYLKGVLPLFKKFKVTIHEVIEADEKMTVHASSVGESASGAPYTNEYMIVVHFVPAPPPAGASALPKMRFVKEFVDSASSVKFFTEERAKAKAREAKEKEEREKQRS